MNTISIIGGDSRQKTVARLLEREGYSVKTRGLYDVEEIKNAYNAKAIILPMPVSRDGIYVNAPMSKAKIKLSEVLDNTPKDCLILGGRFSEELESELQKRNIKGIDYGKREELLIKNAIPTAEAAIETAISKMSITLWKSKILIVGYGRIGKALLERLLPFGAKITVSARKREDFAWIADKGVRAIHTKDISRIIAGEDLILNTVPHEVINRACLENMKDSALIIDLATEAGVDTDRANKLKRNVIRALALPGKTAPETAGAIIAETVIGILEETGV